ncbi:phosphoenolpyruvate synthase [Tolypothrix sp. FACHB-123]|uniref:putative PEP-binding protein n=1 Tax=Tolypothrix sp. FACHB-123 TaxID=2692868 RepID=UPI00168800EB|nr:putative PEP-binding protein [Tolypothrix sp. FACHB-123]MBD2353445.1 phosphoenolpyruvate synthase [Tolypothrix sp. FACHB-123]
MDKLYWLDQIKLQDRAKVGDKAFYLSRIMQRGYPVLPGFVVGAEVLQQFLENLNSSESLVADLPHSSLYLDVTNWRQLQQVAGRLRQEIITASVPISWVGKILAAARAWETEYLIFRPTVMVPNATKALGNISGLLESVFCPCNQEAIASGLKRTWSQLFRARSLLYWQRTGTDLRKVNFAVLVQPVRNAMASGLFHANTSGWEITATWGLGVAIANGEVLPDVYYIQPETGQLIEQQLGSKILAYRIENPATKDSLQPVTPSVLALDNTCLVAYLLEESKQKQYSLQAEYLQQVIVLGNQLVSELGSEFDIEWTISQVNPVPKLYLTQVSAPQSAIPNVQIIKGLGAARGRVTANAYVIANSQLKPEQLPQDVILVAKTITPDWLPILQKIAGIITEKGGLTSHAAILARELGIPAVVSATDVTALIQPGERLLVDGDRGEVSRVREDITIERIAAKGGSPENLELNHSHSPLPSTPAKSHSWESPPLRAFGITSPALIATQLLLNLSQSSLIEQVQSLPVDGVGLLRSELMMLTVLEGQHPNSWLTDGRQAELLERWTEQIMQFACGFAPRPVLYRSLDWRSHELPSFPQEHQSTSQAVLGDRGIFSYLLNPTIFELELAALAKVQKAGYSNVNLMLPFVRSVEEFSLCRQKVEQAGLTQLPQFQLWIMAEVPSVLFLLPEYVKAGVEGISIGTNDLTQLLLGVDREQEQLARRFNELQPAVMSAIAQLIEMSKDAGIPCTICGQAPVLYPEMIDRLVQWGITAISVEPDAVERTYHAIARAEHRLILEAARRQMKGG